MGAEAAVVATPDDVLEALREADVPVQTASQLGDRVGTTRRTALRYLKDLEDRDAVERMDVGARATVWWAAERSRDADDLERVQDAIERALADLPDEVPGRTAVEDARLLLERLVGDR